MKQTTTLNSLFPGTISAPLIGGKIGVDPVANISLS